MKKAIISNFIIIITTFIAVGMYFTGNLDSLGATRFQCLRYFTTLSNILLAIAALIYVVFELKGNVPEWVRLLKFAGTVATAITFITVCTFLAPTAAIKSGPGIIWKFFEKNVFVLHLTSPVLGFITFVFFEKGKIEKKLTIVGAIPSFIYSILYLIMVVILKRWPDFYGFTFGGKYYLSPLVIIVMFGFSYLLSMVVRSLHTAVMISKKTSC